MKVKLSGSDVVVLSLTELSAEARGARAFRIPLSSVLLTKRKDICSTALISFDPMFWGMIVLTPEAPKSFRAGTWLKTWRTSNQNLSSAVDLARLRDPVSIGTFGNARIVTLVTTPNVPPPPPRSAQKRT